jgi:leucyl aminopeptidase
MDFTIDQQQSADVIVYPLGKEDRVPEALQLFDIKPHMTDAGAVTWFYGRRGEQHICLVGLGEAKQLDQLRQAAGNAARACGKEKAETVKISFAGIGQELKSYSSADAVTAWVEGWLLGGYAFDKYKSKKGERNIKTVILPGEDRQLVLQAIERGKIRANGTIFARDLSNEPGNQLRPADLAERAKERFAGTAVAVKVYQGEDLVKHQFNGLISVGKGSENKPLLLEMRYCADPEKPLIALVGKGITFDTGGISLKQGRNISDMRMDMSGAAAVLGALDIIVNSGMPANVVALVAAAENIPDAGALLPGDCIAYPNGVTVQVGNTDAEGRLVLADALIHAHKLGAKTAVDIATLTGACMAALGNRMAGVWGNDEIVDTIRRAAERSGDKVWPMPLEDEYEELLKSDYADVCNVSSGNWAGAITAALFLRKFVDKEMKWAHIDMAGPMEAKSAKGYLTPGATGYGARLLADFVAAQLNL